MTTLDDIGKVSIVVLTYRRNDDLLELLPQLEEQISRVAHDDVEVIVIDNDPEGSARDVIDSSVSPHARYVHEQAPGIAHARNRALDETVRSHLLIFIDDDERPWDTWLRAMLDTYRATGAAGVAGPVMPDYASTPDDWILEGGFFVRRQHPDGTQLPAAGTGNLLLDIRQIQEFGLRFDERFGISGGSDHVFTRDLVRRGGKILWAEAAGVVDKVPGQRLTRHWVLQRAYRVGNTWSRTTLEFAEPGPGRFLSRLSMSGLGVARVCLGGTRVLIGLVGKSKRSHARGSRMMARGLGMISGAWGLAFQEYRRAHTARSGAS